MSVTCYFESRGRKPRLPCEHVTVVVDAERWVQMEGEMLTTESVFPLLKPAVWGQRAETNGTITVPLYADEGVEDRAPVLAYCVDKGDTVAFIREEDLPKTISAKSLHAKAMQNLEYALSDTGWEEVDMRDVVPGLKVLVLGGNYYASEAILLHNRLQQAHQRLRSRRLLVSAPVRGRLLVTEATEPDDDRVAVFVAGCLNEYYGSSSDAPVSPLIWMVEDSEIIGHLEIPEDIERGIAERSSEQQAALQSSVGVSHFSYPEKDGLGYCFTFDAEDREMLYESIQSVLRDFATSHQDNGTLSGNIKIVVQLGPGLAGESQLIDREVASVLRVVERQFEATGLQATSTRPFRLSHEIRNRPSSPDGKKDKDVVRDDEVVSAASPSGSALDAPHERQEVKLFAPGQVALACVFGTPLAGLFMLALNRYVEKQKDALMLLLAGLAAIPLLLGLHHLPAGGALLSVALFVMAAAVYSAAARWYGHDLQNAHVIADRSLQESVSVTFATLVTLIVGISSIQLLV
jgi:hypothetical protein